MNFYEVAVDEGTEFLVMNYTDPELVQDPFDIVALRELEAGIPLALQKKSHEDLSHPVSSVQRTSCIA